MSISESHLQDLLTAATDALFAGSSDLDRVIRRYDVSPAEVASLVTIIRRLQQVFVPVQPSSRFTAKLKDDLLGVQHRGIFARVRYLPARVQIAAGVVAVAGFILLSLRRPIALKPVVEKIEASVAP